MIGVKYLQPALIILYVLAVFQNHSSTAKTSGFSLKLIPRDSPASPLYLGNLTVSERIQSWVKFSYARMSYFEPISIQNATQNLNTISFPMLRDSFYYMVQVGIGNKRVYSLFDTGSGLIWTQCEPCTNCYNLTYPIYDSRASNTYRKLPCSHPLCRGDSTAYQCVNGECRYSYRYSGGSQTKGILSLERFNFSSTANTSRVIENVVFGCSNDNRNFTFERNGKIGGIMGVSLSPTSLVAQLHAVINKRFSYCLVPFSRAMTTPSIVRFGGEIATPTGNVQTTRFVKSRVSKSFAYHLNLIDISVGQHRLGFPSGTFTVNKNGGGGCIIDSGTVLTWIDKNATGVNAYARVISEFENHFSRFNLRKLNEHDNLELCYEYKPTFRQYASMTFHFSGANFVVDPRYVYFFNNVAGYFCIALLPGNGGTIIGACQQQNMRLIYDGNIGSLQFAPENCAQDHH